MIKETIIGEELFQAQTTFYIYRNKEDKIDGKPAFVTSDRKVFNKMKNRAKRTKQAAIYWSEPK